MNDGKGENPLKDARVRKAMSLAIDRDAIVKRIMDGGAVAGLPVPARRHVRTLAQPAVVKYDPAAAKKLLAEAGYANGFDLTLIDDQRPLHQRRPDRAGGRAATSRRSASARRWTR